MSSVPQVDEHETADCAPNVCSFTFWRFQSHMAKFKSHGYKNKLVCINDDYSKNGEYCKLHSRSPQLQK